MRSLIIICFLCLACAVLVHAGEIREIEMTDGGIVSGEILSLSNGIYTIKSNTLGIIKVEESKIRAMRSRSTDNNARRENQGAAGEARTLQEKMMSDKEVMGMIQSLADDPEFKKILEDPEMMKAVNAGDIATLMSNPRFLKLLNNATVQDIQKKVK